MRQAWRYEMLHAGSLTDAKRLLKEVDPDVVVLEPYALGRGRWTEVAALAGGGSAPPGPVRGAHHAGRGGGARPLSGVRALPRQTCFPSSRSR